MNSPIRLTWIRVICAANIVGAGISGFLVTFFPRFSKTYLFGAVVQDGSLFGVTGSIWLAISLLFGVGLFYPLPLIGVFMVQIVYKVIWIPSVSIPLTLQGDPRALPFVFFFALVAAGFVYPVPFRYLFGRLEEVQVRAK